MYKITLNSKLNSSLQRRSKIMGPTKQHSLKAPIQVEQHDDDNYPQEPTIRSPKSLIHQQMSPNSPNYSQPGSAKSSFYFSHDNMKLIPKRQRPKKSRNEICQYLTSFQRYYNQLIQYCRLYDLEKIAYQQQKGMIRPSNKFIQIWSLLFLFYTFLWLIYLPLEIGFKFSNYSYLYLLFKALDISFQLRTAIAINGRLITNSNLVIKHYLSQYLIRDVIIIILHIILIIQIDIPLIIQWIIYIVIIVCSHKKLEYVFTRVYIRSNLYYYEVTILMLYFIFQIHILTCIWNNYLDTHLDYLPQDQFIYQYLNSIYYVIIILTFNGNFMPMSDLAIVLYILTSIFSLFNFSLILKLLVNKQESLYKQLSMYAKNHNLNMDLITQLVSQLELQKTSQETNIPSNISIELQKLINRNFRENILKGYFTYNQTTINELVEQCEEIYTQPNQTIIVEGQLDDSSLYLIIEGDYNIISRNGEILGRADKTFGELSFYTQQTRTATVISDRHGRLLKLPRDKCINSLNMMDKQRFQQQKDSIIFEKQLPIACFCCGSNNHIILQCPMLFYKPQPQDVQDIQSMMSEQDRQQPHPQRRINRFHTPFGLLLNNSLVQELKDLYQQLNDSITSEEYELPYENNVSAALHISKSTDLMPPQSNISKFNSKQSNCLFEIQSPDFSKMQSLSCGQLSPIPQTNKKIRFNMDTKISMPVLPEVSSEETQSIIKKGSFSTFQNLSETDLLKQKSGTGIIGFESLYKFDLYYPQHNYDKTIEEINRPLQTVKSSTGMPNVHIAHNQFK